LFSFYFYFSIYLFFLSFSKIRFADESNGKGVVWALC